MGTAPVERMKMMGVTLEVSRYRSESPAGGLCVNSAPRLSATNRTCNGPTNLLVSTVARTFVVEFKNLSNF